MSLMVHSISAKYSQDNDCLQNSEEVQEITLEALDAGSGFFFVLSTNRWAFDNVEEFTSLVKKFIDHAKLMSVQENLKFDNLE